jgi:hypothetical protein
MAREGGRSQAGRSPTRPPARPPSFSVRLPLPAGAGTAAPHRGGRIFNPTRPHPRSASAIDFDFTIAVVKLKNERN